MQLKAFERSRKSGSATDLLRGRLAYVYPVHSFEQVSRWSLVLGIAEVSAHAWRKRLRKASPWLDWLLPEVLAMAAPVSPWLGRAGGNRIVLLAGTPWKCLGPQGLVWRVPAAFDVLAGRLRPLKVTDGQEGAHLELFALQQGELVGTDRAKGLRQRIAFGRSKLADIVGGISPSKFPMDDEQGAALAVLEWLTGLQAPAGSIGSRPGWLSYAHQRIPLPWSAFRLSQDQQHQAQRRTQRKASKNQPQVQPNPRSFSGGVLVVTTLPQQDWRDEQIVGVDQARWHIERLVKRIQPVLQRQRLRCKTAATATATITLLVLGWALVEEERAAVALAIREAMQAPLWTQAGTRLGPEGSHASWWQEDLCGPGREWLLAQASFARCCQQLRGRYTAERFRAWLPRFQRFLGSGHRRRPPLSTQVCRWLGIPATGPEEGERPMLA